MNIKTEKCTVTLKNPNFSGEKIEEDSYYTTITEFTAAKMSATSDKKFPYLTRSSLPIVCSVIMLVIMALLTYFTSVISTKLTESLIIQKALQINHNLTVDNNNLRCVQESKIANLTAENKKLTAENQNLTAENNKLNKRNQELETQRNNLTEQIQKQSENSIAQIQQNIDAYCPKDKSNNRQCKACESGWVHNQSSCYAINNAKPAEQKTWEEARDDCRRKNSDLAVIVNEDEKRFINENSWPDKGIKGYWIGLRVEDGRWKWINGSDLTESSWIQQPLTNGHCAISVQNKGWKSVNCGEKNAWICQKKALSV